MKYNYIFYSKALRILPKQTIWQPWSTHSIDIHYKTLVGLVQTKPELEVWSMYIGLLQKKPKDRPGP
jgi:hypothetical protein